MFNDFEIERKGISERAADHIKQMIVDGRYEVNQKLPGEREMALNLKVSRNTVREAYKILEAYGYVRIKHGTGIFVASEEHQILKMTSFFFVSTDRIKDLFAIRKILEKNAIQWAIENASDEQINKLSQIVEEAKTVADKGEDYASLARLDHQFHLALADISQNSVLIRIMHNLIDLLEESRMQVIQIPGRPVKSVDEHADIIEALKVKDVTLAQKYMEEHLESVEKSIMENLKAKDIVE
ncbi:GntR family transcriptional regulator [Thalassobacillus devorans]|uniref:GntR family transcriptional regulator n=1 Tax=Thalassobacillus devorans TaxID=279813 RepID=A0ABQ1NSC3_9BACI|nr:FadR/GntR family transcriptional regulator [Thalassobacillus devorans]NIK28765.1 GntR family transcriptional repressor for pyruvate dehydrogenase complex [Thalassobacillus devorans]GGC83722.1 GntR family transcriptional regulator [Thalassobacillus devorans]